MIRIAVAADLHLPDRSDTQKEAVWQWLLRYLRQEKVDIFVGAGDLTSIGTVCAAERIMTGLRQLGIPYILTPGNSEMRTPEQMPQVLQLMETPVELFPVAVLDSASGKLSASAAEFLRQLQQSGRRNLLVATHCPPDTWNSEDQTVLAEAIASGVIGKLVYGHKHFDRTGGTMEAIRGLDPDKAIGGAPAVAIYTLDADRWLRQDIVCPAADMPEWPQGDRRKFFGNIGICGMKTPVEYLHYAADKKIGNFELRYREPETFAAAEFQEALNRWRQQGGRILSLHLPDIRWEDAVFTGQEKMAAAVEIALQCRCQRVTLHVPRGYQNEFADARMLERTAQEFIQCLQPLLDHDVVIGVENLHTTDEERRQQRYKFGCTPAECRKFIGALQRAAGAESHLIGFHLDIGHARNNAPFCHLTMLSEWYAEMGSLINGMHIHQVNHVDGEMKNHIAFTGLFARLISLAGLGMAWRSGQIGHDVPMFLELRTPASETWECLQRELRLNK